MTPAALMPATATLRLLLAALGRCRYCYGGERCPVCRATLDELEALYRAALAA
jgi:hypothetical protein